MRRLSRLKLMVFGTSVLSTVAMLALAGGCAREILSVDFASQQSVDLATERQTLLIVGAGFDKTSQVVLEMDGIAPVPLQTKFNTTGMLEATLSRVDLSKALQAGVRYSASVCVHNDSKKACSDNPLLVTLAPDGERRVTGSSVTKGKTDLTSSGDGTTGSSSGGEAGSSGTSDPTNGTKPASEGNGNSLATSAVVTGEPYSSPATPTPEPTQGGQASFTPTPTPTSTPTPTATPIATPTPTRTPVPGKDIIFLIAGVLNGQQIDPADPAISVKPGQAIQGSIRIAVHNTWGFGVIFPLGATYSWGDPQTSYWQVSGSVPPASVTEYAVQVNLAAPSRPGEYFIIVAGTAERSLDHVMSSTRWDAGVPRWNDSNDVARWDEDTIQSAIRNGYVTALCDPASRCDFAATAIVVQVSD